MKRRPLLFTLLALPMAGFSLLARDHITVGGSSADFPGFTDSAILAALDHAQETGVSTVRLDAGEFEIRADFSESLFYAGQKGRPVSVIGAGNGKTILKYHPSELACVTRCLKNDPAWCAMNPELAARIP